MCFWCKQHILLKGNGQSRHLALISSATDNSKIFTIALRSFSSNRPPSPPRPPPPTPNFSTKGPWNCLRLYWSYCLAKTPNALFVIFYLYVINEFLYCKSCRYQFLITTQRLCHLLRIYKPLISLTAPRLHSRFTHAIALFDNEPL